jgi:isopenicillin N synthase-like dioxygenase
MGFINETDHQVFVIPSVDVSAYLADPCSSESKKVITQVRDACRTSGFFQITGHGVSSSLRDSVLEAAKTFFKLPSEEKVKYSSVQGRGYEKIGEQILEPGTKPELKEVSVFYHKGKSPNRF